MRHANSQATDMDEFFEKSFGTSPGGVRPISRELTLSPLPSLSGSIRYMRPVPDQSAPVTRKVIGVFYFSGPIVGENLVLEPRGECLLRLIDSRLRRNRKELCAAPIGQGS